MQLRRPTVHSIMITSGLYFIIIAIIVFMAIQNSRLKISLTEHRAYIAARDVIWYKLFSDQNKLIERNKADIEESQKLIRESQKDIKDSKQEIVNSHREIKISEEDIRENKRLTKEVRDIIENFIRKQLGLPQNQKPDAPK